MDPHLSAVVLYFLVGLVTELKGERAKISDGDSLDMDCDLNKLSTEELRSYGDILYLRLAKAEGATEVVGFLREHFKGRKEALTLADVRYAFAELSNKFIDPALKTRDRLNALNALWMERVNATNTTPK
ncbi:unnamed protein product [Bemisia tabaci]|uniref:Uncharacterized protein n=1 Tax=Bemisia tabaci TaxID=7038 RepID=A0A9P0AF69_BEMTA|nr:unnamed protein product [Bemisia tabaci]